MKQPSPDSAPLRSTIDRRALLRGLTTFAGVLSVGTSVRGGVRTVQLPALSDEDALWSASAAELASLIARRAR